MATPDTTPLPDMTAAELVLGLLDGDERDAALHRLARDPAFAVEVDAWRDWLGALYAAWPGIEAPAAVSARIEASLDTRGGVPAAANDNQRWRRLAAVAGLAACLLLVMTVMLVRRPPPAPVRIPVAAPAPLIAAIAPTARGAPIAAAYDPASGTVRIAGGVDVPAGRTAEVWAIRGEEAPRSLGLLPRAGARLTVPAGARAAMAPDTVLAISIEPAGGSPTGLPTGPVVATGKLSG